MCDCMQQLKEGVEAKGYIYPFERGISLDKTTVQFVVGQWAATMYRKTPTGRRSKVNTGSLILSHCVVCGESLALAEGR